MFKRFLKSGPVLKKLGKMRKNEQKWAKIAAPESPNIHYYRNKRSGKKEGQDGPGSLT